MQTDPTRWLVSLAGFSYDWIITREWKKILLTMLPVYLFLGLAGAVFWGSHGNKMGLARWYLELGNKEIAGWENALAPADKSTTPPDADQDAASEEKPVDAEDASKETKIPPFASTLFRKVQLLQPSDKSQYVIGATLAQQGAISQAEQILTKIAPNDAAGYPPAHMILTEFYAARLRTNPAKFSPFLLHHITQACRWERIPIKYLMTAANLYANSNRAQQALNFLAMAAERDPARNTDLSVLAAKVGNVKLAERALRNAARHFEEELKISRDNTEARVRLASIHLKNRRPELAEKTLFETGVKREPKLARAQSQFYVLKFENSLLVKNGNVTLAMGDLEKALQLDPTNTGVQDIITRVVDSIGVMTDEMQRVLDASIASGQTANATHMLRAETYLKSDDYKNAIPHLEQVVHRMPNQFKALNNLAYCLTKVYPDRSDEAVALANRAIAAASKIKDTKLVNREKMGAFYDTLSIALAQSGKTSEAITAISSAINMDAENPVYHRRAIELYSSISAEGMVTAHKTILQRLEAKQPD